MNCIYRSIWNEKTGTFVAASEDATSGGKKASSCTVAGTDPAHLALKSLVLCLAIGFGAAAYALPQGGVVAAGGANVVPVFYDGTNWRIG